MSVVRCFILLLAIIIGFSGGTDLSAQDQNMMWKLDYGWPNTFTFHKNDGLKISHQRTSTAILNDVINIQMNDSLGEFLFGFNGCWLLNKEGQIMLNGDSMSPSLDHLHTCWTKPQDNIYPGSTTDSYEALPWPDHEGYYYLIQIPRQENFSNPGRPYLSDSVYYSIINMDGDNGLGEVVEKNVFFADLAPIRPLASASVRHANGRDWWIVYYNFECTKLTVFLLDPSGLQLQETIDVSFDVPRFQYGYKQGGAHTLSFSPQGDRILCTAQQGNIPSDYTRLYWFDFDRCSGGISSPLSFDILEMSSDHNYIHGPVRGDFGPNGRYVYIANKYELIQFDTETQSHEVLLEDYRSNPDWESVYYLERSAIVNINLGIDGKIYVNGGGNNWFFHTVELPHKGGMASKPYYNKIDVRPHQKLSEFPDMPNYRLGPVDGSECDTLGIDNIPVAWFRYDHDGFDPDVDMIDLSYYNPTEWQWDFGDGGMSRERYPMYHYSEPGIYTICLTVSNENATSEVFCREIEIESVSIVDLEAESLKFWPNPVQGALYYDVSGINEEIKNIFLVDINGRVIVDHKVLSRKSSLNLSGVKSGVYQLIFTKADGYKITEKIILY